MHEFRVADIRREQSPALGRHEIEHTRGINGSADGPDGGMYGDAGIFGNAGELLPAASRKTGAARQALTPRQKRGNLRDGFFRGRSGGYMRICDSEKRCEGSAFVFKEVRVAAVRTQECASVGMKFAVPDLYGGYFVYFH